MAVSSIETNVEQDRGGQKFFQLNAECDGVTDNGSDLPIVASVTVMPPLAPEVSVSCIKLKKGLCANNYSGRALFFCNAPRAILVYLRQN